MRSHPKLLCTALLLGMALGSTRASADVLDPTTLTKYMDALPIPGPMPMAGPNYYEIGAWQIQQRLHAQLPLTTVWGYGSTQATASYPAATIEARRGVPIDIHWTNHLPMTHLLSYAIDPTLMKAYTTTGVPMTVHVHGNEVEPQSDGGPFTWFTPGFAEKGPDWKHEVYHYANNQLPATLWYHDHAFGFTRHNVYAGLAGFYVLRDPGHEPAGLPSGPYEIPVAIQDKMLTTDGQLWYPNEGETPEHPIWVPEFFGNLIIVNGKLWPYLNVEPRKYRFRLLNGANARFFSLALADRVTGAPGPAFNQIGSDGGYLAEPVVLNDPADPKSPRLVMAPAERCDVVIDFSAYAPGTEFLLRNTAKAPFPSGEAPNPNSTGQIMLFRVVPSTGPDASVIPNPIATVKRLSNPTRTRTMTLNEVEGISGPLEAMLNGLNFDAPETEQPTLGTTEMWEIVNMTGDTHPIHIHLIQFQLLNRQKYNLDRYEDAFEEANPELGESYTPVDVTPYLKGKAKPADANERGWKDTYRMNPGEVTRILVRFAPQDDSPAFAFDATAEPGYVWHCHILEHEENDMMRPYHLLAPATVAQLLGNRGVSATPGVTLLREPKPNPTPGGATFRFTLREPDRVELALYSVTGQLVRQLASVPYGAGESSVLWDGRDDAGRAVPAGVYFVNLRAGGVTVTRKMFVAP
ncbi:MAG TPA: multicopper oxidase domain-containing protein [Verrucomicrobiae bacterium]|nr:multicopper oxidase domain-containing protein [Verrucomicrobiae bacterium]